MDGYAPYAVGWFAAFAVTLGFLIAWLVYFLSRQENVNQAKKELNELKARWVQERPHEYRRQLQLTLAYKRQELDNLQEEIDELRVAHSEKITKETI